MNYTGYSVLEIPKIGAAFSYAKEARDFATGATGAGGYLNSTAVSNSWTDVRFISAIYEGSTSLPLSIGATLPDLYTGAATVIGGSTPIGDLRSEDGPYVGVGNSSVYYTKKGQEYGAAFYATYIGATNSAPTKIGIGTTSTDISTSGYYEGSFTTREIYEFETSFTPDLDDLTKTITGSGVYKNGDSVSLQFNILNRNGELLTSAAQIAADPFIDKQVISILDVDSNVVFPNYRDNGDSTFTFSRSQNIDVFGTYTRNFGVRNEIVNKNGLTSTGEFYLYGNTTTFDNILVQASGETVLNENLSNHSPPDTGSITSAADRADAIKYFNNQPVNTSGSTGFIELSLAFNEDPTFTEYSNLNIWASDTENFDSNIGNFLGSFPLDFSQEGQTIRLTPDNGIQDGTGLFFKLAVESSVEFEKEVFNLGPFTIEPIVEGPDLNLYNQGDQSMVGDFTIEGGLEGDSSNGGNLNVSGNALGTGIGGRLTGPESKMYLLSGDAGTESDTLQSVTFRGQSTDVGLSLIGSTPLSFDGTEGVPQTDKSIYYDNSDESLYFGHGIKTIQTDIAGGGPIGTTLRLFPSHSVTVGADGIIVGSSPATGSAILGGRSGIISGHYSTIVGGFSNRVSGSNFGFIGGGSGIEVIDSVYSSSVGGYNNDISGSAYSVIGGGQDNLIASGNKNFIGGGSSNTISGSQAVVSAILGGENNLITGLNSVLLGGNSNEILSSYSFIGGGEENITSGTFSAISAGESNKTFGLHSIIAGGQENIASGTHSFIGGGHLNTASANYSYAFGRRAEITATNEGAAVFADGQNRTHASSGAHTATLDFAGGVYVPTSGMFGEGLFVSGVPVLTGEINPPEVDTLQTVTTRGNETTTSIISTGPYISGVTGLFSDKVGIGTTSPSSALEVRGGNIDIGTNDIEGAANCKIEMDAANGFTLTNPNNAHGVDIVADDLTFFGGGLGTRKITTNAGDLSIDPTADLLLNENGGNVGIGTDNPTERVEVSGSLLLGPRSSSPGDTMPFLKIDGYDEHGIEMGWGTWTKWKITTEVNGKLEIYNTGIQHQSQQVSIGKQGYHKQGNLMVYSTGSVLRAGHNSTNYSILDIGVQDANSSYQGDAYIDVRADTSALSRFHFKRDGEFIASGVSVSGDVLGTGVGNRITNNNVPYLLSGDSPAETQTLQDVCDNGNETTTSIFSTGPYISGITGLFNKEFHVGDLGSNSHAFNFEKGNGLYDTNIVLKPFGNPGGFNSSYWMTVSKQAYSGFITNGNNSDFYIGHDLNKTALKLEYDGGGVSTFTTSNTDINFENGTLFVDESAQRVGIGTTDPAKKLHVEGDSQFIGDAHVSGDLTINHPSFTTYQTGKIFVNSSNQFEIDYGSRQVLRATNVTTRIFGQTDVTYVDAGSFSIDLKAGLGGQLKINNYWGDDDLAFYSHGGDKIMSVDTDASADSFVVASDSNVGIGTSSPNSAFHVEGVVSGSNSFLGTGDGNRITNNGVPYLLSGDSPAETQTLQDVTDNGNTTTNDIITSGDVQADEFIGDLRGAVSFRAKAAEALSAGEVVFISGIDGNTTVVAKADANDPTRMPAFGVSKETVNANANVRIVNFGSVSNINTSSYSEGDELFVSNTAGLLTGIAPTGESSALQKMAKVTRSHASAGSITVMGAGRTNAVPNLNEGNLFVGDSNNQAVADDTINVDIANSTVGISGVLSIPSGRAVASEDVYYIVKLTQAEYDALTPDASTMYIITDEDFNSPVINPIKTVASNYTITDTDYTILVSGSSTVNITLPSATINSNYVYNIKNITTNSVVVTPSAGYIDGDISKTINQKFESIATQSDGSNWYII